MTLEENIAELQSNQNQRDEIEKRRLELRDVHMNALKMELQRPEYKGMSQSEAYSFLHDSQTVRIPVKVPKKLSLADTLHFVSRETAIKLVVNPNITDFRDKIVAQDRQAVSLWVTLFAAGGVITSEEAVKMNELLAATEDGEIVETISPRIGKAFPGVELMPNSIDPEDFATVFANVQIGGE